MQFMVWLLKSSNRSKQCLEILVQIFGFTTLKSGVVGGKKHSNWSGILTYFSKRELEGGGLVAGIFGEHRQLK